MPLLVEMGWGGLVQAPATITWTDISEYVHIPSGVTITRGASDELSDTQPGTASLVLDNSDGRFTPGNSASPYYPYVRRNAPIRIAVALMPTVSGSAPYPLTMCGDDFDNSRLNSMWTNVYGGAGVVGGRARIPLSPGVSSGLQSSRQWTLPNSSLSVRWNAAPGANGSSAAAANFALDGVTTGNRIGFSYNAVTGMLRCVNMVGFVDNSSVDLAYSAIDHRWLRIREASGTVYWETSGDGFGWTVRRSLATPSWASTDSLVVSLTTSRTGGTGDYTEWDLLGATVRPRFWGVVNEFPVDWQGLISTVRITCTDLFKRLNRLPALRSMAAEEILLQGPRVYYPLTEDSTATSAGDLSGNGLPALTILQAGSGGTLAMGGASGPPETGEQVPTFTPVSATAGKWLSGDLGPDVELSFMLYLTFEVWFQTTTPGRCFLGVHNEDLQEQHILSVAPGGGLQIEWVSSGSTMATESISGPTNLADGNWHHVVYDQREGKIWIDGVLADSSISVLRCWQERFLHIGGYRGTRLWNGSIAHAAIYVTTDYSVGPLITGHYAAGATGFAGETSDARIERLASYAGLSSVTLQGSTFDPIASQGQGGSQVVARMREVEATESARLFVTRDWYGLAFQSRDIRYNPDPASESFTIAYADLETGDVRLADDDQKLVNSLEATRPGGATQKVTAPSSILAFGVYDPGAMTVLKTSDNSVLDAAYWRVSRYANPQPELREVPIEAYTMANYLPILDADISNYFSVTGLPAQAPASSMRVTIEGYTETIREKSHLIQFHTSAASTDNVWVLDDPTYSVLDSTTRLAY